MITMISLFLASNPIQRCTMMMVCCRYKEINKIGLEMAVENELFDLENDPQEMENISTENGSLIEEMEAELKIKMDQRLEG